MRFLYHLVSASSAADGLERSIAPAAGIGFVHLCRFEQVEEVVRRHFPSQAMAALIIDPHGLDLAKLIEEDSYGHGAYPHYYAEIPIDAVIGRMLLPPPRSAA